MTEPLLAWYGHDSFKIVGDGVVIYIDPWKLPPHVRPADIILITHEHFDHCSPDDVRAITKDGTRLVMPQVCADKFPGVQIDVVHPGESLTIGQVTIEAVPAYNLGKDFHPPADQRVGYIVTVGGQRLYHAGDTDLIPEMATIRCDMALLPVSGTYVMTADEAAEAAKQIKPRVVIPMHYGSVIGSIDDAKRFQALVPPEIEVRILKQTIA